MAVRQGKCWQEDQSLLAKAAAHGLLREIESLAASERTKTELWLAAIEWQRVSGVNMELDAIFDAIVVQIAEEKSTLVKEVVSTCFVGDDRTGMVDWLIQLVGTRASLAVTRPRNGRDVQAAFAGNVESPATLLACFCALSQETSARPPVSSFHVVALDGYLKAAKWTASVASSWRQFSIVIPTSTKLFLLARDFEMRNRKVDREQMYAEIYSGANYHRSSSSAQRKKLTVARETLVQDSRALISDDSDDTSLFDGIYVHFAGEEGQDGGGLTKEWILLLVAQLASRVFVRQGEAARSEVDPGCTLWEAELMGVVVGLSVRHQIVIDVAFPRFVYRLLLARPAKPTLEDLADIRPSLARGLGEILQWQETDFSERLSTNFTYTTSLGESIPLLAGGQDQAVTYDNRSVYVERMCHFIVAEQSRAQLDALHRGFDRVCATITALHLFSLDEFDSLIRGQQVALTVDALRRLCCVEGGDDEYVNRFWATLEALGPDVVQQLLSFVTATDRISLSSATEQAVFQIVILHGQQFSSRLPTASTCTNTLFLPRYPTIDMLQTRLQIALLQGSVGFGLK